MTGSSWASSSHSRRVMLGNRSRDTQPELLLRRAIFAAGLRYRVDKRPLDSLNRRADVVFPVSRVAVFVDGCYWHGCPSHHVPSRSNALYWSGKIEANRRRDLETTKLLEAAGWTVLRFWEHEDLTSCASVVVQVVRQLRGAVG